MKISIFILLLISTATNLLAQADLDANGYNKIYYPNGSIHLLPRGGSDLTAAIMASLLNAEILEIWTDVSGVFTADPRKIKQAYPLKEISYEEVMELSHFGAKVIFPPTILPVMRKASR